MSRRSRRLPGDADILVTATVQARELRADEVPETNVHFTGDAAESSTSGSVRWNLPDRVEPGVTYRDVRVEYAIAAVLAEPDASAEQGWRR